MVVFKAFKAIRPRADLANKIATLPYDVLSSAEARALAKANPFSFLHIDKSEVDLAESVDPHGSEVYAKAASNLQEFLEKDWLEKDSTEQFYLYELTWQGRTQTGLVGCTAVSDYENGQIKRHEFTLPEKELDRIHHFEATNTNSSPIFLAYHAQTEIQELMNDWKVQHEAQYDFESFYGVRHRVFVIDQAEVLKKFERLFANVPALYIADGHHRAASAAKVGLKRRGISGDLPDADYQYFLSVVFPDNELEILDYNRVIQTPLPFDFWDKVAEKFELQKIEKSKPSQIHEIHAYVNAQWYKLQLKDQIIPDDEVNRLDVAILQNEILAPLLGIDDPKTSPNIKFVGGIRGLDELEKEVDAGASIAFALFAPSMDQLLAVADAGKIMPAKSTWFEPKLLSGLFLHQI